MHYLVIAFSTLRDLTADLIAGANCEIVFGSSNPSGYLPIWDECHAIRDGLHNSLL